MIKKAFTVSCIIAIVTFSIFMVYRYSQYILAWQANARIDVSGIKLMMKEDEVRRLIGEEEYMPGFGGYGLNYPSKGIFLTFLDDGGTDFYHKVNKIEIIDSKYEIFGVRVGDEYDKALRLISKQGFTKQKEGFPGRWKINMYITLDKNDSKVQKITIGIRDRVSSSRVY